MPKRSKQEVYKKVQKVIGKEAMRHTKRFLETNKPKLWGRDKSGDFLDRCLNLAIYKYVENIGYKQLDADTKEWNKLSHHSITENTHRITDKLALWGENQIIAGDKEIWEKHMEGVSRRSTVADVNLFVDSTDYAIEGRFKKAKDEPYYSKKVGGLARRFMLVCDGRGVVRGLWGGYSPKMRDNNFLESHRQTFQRLFKGGVILGDTHFNTKAKLRGFKIVAPVDPFTQIRTVKKGDKIKLKKADLQHNNRVAKLRARVEHPFGHLCKKFKALGKPFADGDVQLDNLVTFGFGVLNGGITKEFH